MHAELEVFLDFIPLKQRSPFHPFTGMVLNINCCTTVHRDPQDRKICVVVPFGNWTGGELVLHDLGLVLELSQGDIVAFRSDRVTHYNLHHVGQRGSFVIHSDKHIGKWPFVKEAYKDLVVE